MTFRANLYATGYLGHALSLVALVSVFGLGYARAYAELLVLVVVLTTFVARLHSRRMDFGESVFRYTGWMRSFEALYSEVVKVEHSGGLGYPTDRWHGPLEYRVTTRHRRFWVSLMWFNADAARMFRNKVAAVSDRASE